MEQVAEIPSGQEKGRYRDLQRVSVSFASRVAVSIIDHVRNRGRTVFQRHYGPRTWQRPLRVFCLRFWEISLPRPRADSRRRARIFIVEKCKGGRREYSPRGQSAPAKEGTDISRRKRRFRVVVPLFAVGIIIGLPGNPGRAARWLVRFRVRQWKPTTVQKEERRAGSSVAKGRKQGSAWARWDEAGGGRTRGRRAGFWLRIVANHFNCARSSLEPLMASSVSDTAASGSSGRSSTSRCSPSRTKTPRKHMRALGWESHALLLLLTAEFELLS